MSELQAETLAILCHGKTVPVSGRLYDVTVDLFSETIELVDALTRSKGAELSSDLDASLKTLHDQLRLWMEWFYLASDPELARSKPERPNATASRLLQHVLRLLQILESNVPKIVTLKASKGFTPSHLTMTTAKTWVMRVFNNLIYDNFELQDKVTQFCQWLKQHAGAGGGLFALDPEPMQYRRQQSM